jgi:hypothetical protein
MGETFDTPAFGGPILRRNSHLVAPDESRRDSINQPRVASLRATLAEAVLRENIIQHIDNGSDPNGYSRAFELHDVEQMLLENNIISLGPDSDSTLPLLRAMAYSNPRSIIRTASNWTPAGKLITAYLLNPPWTAAPEFETKVKRDLEEVALSRFLKRKS